MTRPYSGLSRRDREADAAAMSTLADQIGPLLDAVSDPSLPPRSPEDASASKASSGGTAGDYTIPEANPGTEYVQQVECEGLEPRDTIVEALERARVVGVLDAWRSGTQVSYRATWCMGWRDACVLQLHDIATGELVSQRDFEGRNADAARAAAAKAISEGAV